MALLLRSSLEGCSTQFVRGSRSGSTCSTAGSLNSAKPRRNAPPAGSSSSPGSSVKTVSPPPGLAPPAPSTAGSAGSAGSAGAVEVVEAGEVCGSCGVRVDDMHKNTKFCAYCGAKHLHTGTSPSVEYKPKEVSGWMQTS